MTLFFSHSIRCCTDEIVKSTGLYVYFSLVRKPLVTWEDNTINQSQSLFYKIYQISLSGWGPNQVSGKTEDYGL